MTLTPHEDSNSYSPELLNSMEQAFKAVWQMLYAHMPVEGDNAHELQIKLSQDSRQLGVGRHNGPRRSPS